MDFDSSFFRWTPLGGLSEVGMNCMLMQFGDTCFAVDAGVLFADKNDFGIEAIFPDFRELLASQKVKNWLITHAHEDHIGAVPAIISICQKNKWPIPRFWAPPLAAALIREKLKEGLYSGPRVEDDRVTEVEIGKVFELEKVQVEYLNVCHSTPDSCSLRFQWEATEGKSLEIVHSADFKLEKGRLTDDFNRLQGSRPDFLFLDSTNSDREGHSVSEDDIVAPLAKLIREHSGRCFVTLFSSNLQRIASLASIAESTGRRLCLQGRSMQNFYRVARSLGIFKRWTSFEETTIVESQELKNLPPEKQLILCSGSQGEHRSVLSRMANGSHPDFKAGEGDLFIFSSKMIPGNEKSVFRVINGLLASSAKVLWADRAKKEAGGPVHASGHGRKEELSALVNFLKPKSLIPVHGQRYQLEACAGIVSELEEGLAPEVFLAENNSTLSFDWKEGHWELVDRYNESDFPPRYLRFQNFVTSSRDPFLKFRKRAALGGVVAYSILSNGRRSYSHRGVLPEGEMDSKKEENLKKMLEEWGQKIYRQLHKDWPRDTKEFENELSEELERDIRKVTGQKALCLVTLMDC